MTARRREERLLDVPVSAAVMTTEEIDRYRTRDLAELTHRIPGVQISHGYGGGQGGNLAIRGISNLAVDYGSDQPVSLVLDGMPFSRSHILDVGFFDVESVEVPVQILSGSLSTVFGATVPWPDPGPYFGSYINYHQIWDNDVESYSVFASFDYDFSERWSLSAGARYTEEKRKSSGGNVFENSGALGFGPVGLVYHPKDDSTNVSPEVTLSWHPQPDLLVFLAYKTGFQSAGISNPGTVPNLASLPVDVANDSLVFDETTVKGFEAGIKGRFMDGRLSAELVGFAFESKDLQVGIFNSNTTTFTLQNAAVAQNWGFEAQATLQATDALQLRLAGQYNHLEFDKWEDAGCHPVDGALPDLDTRTGPGCHIGPQGAPIQDLSGERYGGPPVQVNVGATYDTPIGGDWGLELNWDTIYHSKGKRVLNQPFTEIPHRSVTHLAATLYQQEGPWQVGLICSNCFDKSYVTFIGNKPLAKINPGVNGDMTANIEPPRLVTLEVTYSLK